MAVKKVRAVIAPTPGTVTMCRHVSLPRARRTSSSSSGFLRSPATRHAASNAAMAARTSGSVGQTCAGTGSRRRAAAVCRRRACCAARCSSKTGKVRHYQPLIERIIPQTERRVLASRTGAGQRQAGQPVRAACRHHPQGQRSRVRSQAQPDHRPERLDLGCGGRDGQASGQRAAAAHARASHRVLWPSAASGQGPGACGTWRSTNGAA
jgi:hypothetical protein